VSSSKDNSNSKIHQADSEMAVNAFHEEPKPTPLTLLRGGEEGVDSSRRAIQELDVSFAPKSSHSPSPIPYPSKKTTASPSPFPKLPSSGLARLTLRSVNFCGSTAGDTFCTDFFADQRVGLTLFGESGSTLLREGGYLQLFLGATVTLGLLTMVRLILATCKAKERGVETYCTTRRFLIFAGISMLSTMIGALLGAYALRRYAYAISSFLTASQDQLQVPSGAWELKEGWTCGAAAVVFNTLATFLFLIAIWGARKARTVAPPPPTHAFTHSTSYYPPPAAGYYPAPTTEPPPENPEAPAFQHHAHSLHGYYKPPEIPSIN